MARKRGIPALGVVSSKEITPEDVSRLQTIISDQISTDIDELYKGVDALAGGGFPRGKKVPCPVSIQQGYGRPGDGLITGLEPSPLTRKNPEPALNRYPGDRINPCGEIPIPSSDKDYIGYPKDIDIPPMSSKPAEDYYWQRERARTARPNDWGKPYSGTVTSTTEVGFIDVIQVSSEIIKVTFRDSGVSILLANNNRFNAVALGASIKDQLITAVTPDGSIGEGQTGDMGHLKQFKWLRHGTKKSSEL